MGGSEPPARADQIHWNKVSEPQAPTAGQNDHVSLLNLWSKGAEFNVQIGQQVDTHRHVHCVECELRLAKKVIARDPTKHLVVCRLLVIKQGVYTALLAKVGQGLEEA